MFRNISNNFRISNNVNSKYCLYIVLFFLSILYIIYSNYYTSSIPYQDEIDDFLSYLIKIESTKGHKINLSDLLKTRTVHRQFISKIALLIGYKLTGVFNAKHLLLIGNTIYCISWLYILKNYDHLKTHKADIAFLILIYSFVLIPINMFSNWAMVSVGFSVKFLLLAICINLLQKKSKFSLTLIIFFTSIAIATGSGIIVFISIFIALLFNNKYTKKDKLYYLIISLILSFFSIYSQNNSNELKPNRIESIFSSSSEIIQYFLASLGMLFKNILNRLENVVWKLIHIQIWPSSSLQWVKTPLEQPTRG